MNDSKTVLKAEKRHNVELVLRTD